MNSGAVAMAGVPFGVPLLLVAVSTFFKLSDATGSPLEGGIPLLVTAGKQPDLIRVIVAGKN